MIAYSSLSSSSPWREREYVPLIRETIRCKPIFMEGPFRGVSDDGKAEWHRLPGVQLTFPFSQKLHPRPHEPKPTRATRGTLCSQSSRKLFRCTIRLLQQLIIVVGTSGFVSTHPLNLLPMYPARTPRYKTRKTQPSAIRCSVPRQ